MKQKVPITHEKLDTTPVSIPLRFTRAANLSEVVRDMIRGEELRRIAVQAEFESFEEADDFDIGDDYDPSSPYEEEFEGLSVKELKARKLVDDEKEATARMPDPSGAANSGPGDGQKPTGGKGNGGEEPPFSPDKK